jgi:predicted PurR-regulated permease PerM
VATTRSTDASIARLQPAVDRSRARWRLLGARLATITPEAIGRGLVVVVITLAAAWLSAATWPALLPFAVGGLLAYAVYPIVGILDRVLPRVVAATLAILFGLVVIGAVIAVVVPPLVQAGLNILQGLPDSAQLAQLREQVEAYLATLPDATRVLVAGVLDRITTIARVGLSGFLDGIAELIVTGVLNVFDTIGFVVGLVLLPVWIVTVVRDGRSLRTAVAAQFSPGIRPDAMALITIVHRAVSTFLRVQLAAAAGVGVLVYVGLAGMERLDLATFPNGIAIATYAGAVQVIPQLGGILGLVPAILGFVTRPDEPAVWGGYLAIYLVSTRLVSMAVGGRLGRDLNVRPALALPAFAILSQVGLLWLLFSAPILVVARDAISYVRGRLAEPPLPAGVLPGRRPATRPSPAPAAPPPLYRDATGGIVRGQVGSTRPAGRPTPAPPPATAVTAFRGSPAPVRAATSAPVAVGASPTAAPGGRPR